MNIPLTARNNLEIDGAYVVTAKTLSVDQNIPLTTHKGNGGVIGIVASSGADVTGSIVFVIPAGVPEIDFFGWAKSDVGKTLVFTEGQGRITLAGAKMGGQSWSSDPGAATYLKTVKFTATDIF